MGAHERYRHYTNVEAVNLIERIATMEARLDAVDKAVEVARREMERRLEGMNEFREQLRSQSATFITREAADLVWERITSDIKLLNRAKDQMEGKASQLSVLVALVLSVIGLLIGLAGMLRHFKV